MRVKGEIREVVRIKRRRRRKARGEEQGGCEVPERVFRLKEKC